MSSTVAIPPSVSWAQRSACVMITFNVECDKPDIKIEKKCVSFNGVCAPDQKLHAVDIPLYAEVVPEKSEIHNKGRQIEVILAKEKIDEPFWPYLTSDKKKYHWLKIDFNNWQDEEDSENEDNIDSMNDMFSSKMGMGDYPDDKDETSSVEEEDLPDLE